MTIPTHSGSVKDFFDLDRCRIFIAEMEEHIENLRKFYDNGVMCSMAESIHGQGICADILKTYREKREEYNV